MAERVAVLGAGSWGTAIAIHLASKGCEVRLWGRPEDGIPEIETSRENRLFLPGIHLSPLIKATVDEDFALDGAKTVVFAVPAQVFRSVAVKFKPKLSPQITLVNTAKGIETHSLLRLSQVFAEIFDPPLQQQLVVLSGPSHAEEVARDLPTAAVVSSPSQKLAEQIQDLFISPGFRIYTNSDITGVELGGALKNVIALGIGMSDGIGYGDNTRAALITRGLTEIKRLGIALGAQATTFSGLSGMGDLIVTCNSMHSRNRRAGILLGQGIPLDKVLTQIGMVVEGVETTKAAQALAQKYQVDMPITNQIYQVLFAGLSPQEAVNNLMLRQRKHETELPE